MSQHTTRQSVPASKFKKGDQIVLDSKLAELNIFKKYEQLSYQKPDFWEKLSEEGYFFVGMKEPDEEIKDELEKLTKQGSCFETAKKVSEKYEHLTYYEGWAEDYRGIIPHAFLVDENMNVIDPTWYFSERIRRNPNPEEYFRTINYVGMPVSEHIPYEKEPNIDGSFVKYNIERSNSEGKIIFKIAAVGDPKNLSSNTPEIAGVQ